MSMNDNHNNKNKYIDDEKKIKRFFLIEKISFIISIVFFVLAVIFAIVMILFNTKYENELVESISSKGTIILFIITIIYGNIYVNRSRRCPICNSKMN